MPSTDDATPYSTHHNLLFDVDPASGGKEGAWPPSVSASPEPLVSALV